MFEAYYDKKPEFKSVPFHKLSDREYWDRLKPFVEEETKGWNFDYIHLPASLFAEFYLKGEREKYDQGYYDNLASLSYLAVLEAAYNDGRYFEKLVDCLWFWLGEMTWELPTHTRHGNANADALADPMYHTLDIFQAEVGAVIAVIYYIFKEKFDEYSRNINVRILKELKERVIDTFNNHTEYLWMGLSGERVNNWNPWIVSNVLLVSLITKDSSVFPKALTIAENYVRSSYEDGGCDEGPGYWGKSGATLVFCAIYLKHLGIADLSDNAMIKNCAEFGMKENLFGNTYANFSDAHITYPKRYGVCRQLALFVGSKELYDFAHAAYIQRNGIPDIENYTCLLSLIPCLEAMADFEGKTEHDFNPSNFYIESIQVKMIHKDGFDVAIKGGHNDESHNHNDVGNFIIAKDKQLFVIDTGNKQYRKETFSGNRYDIWVFRSLYHNLPEIGGMEQKAGDTFCATSPDSKGKNPGSCYCATDVSVSDNGFEADIARAYGSGDILSWKRTLSVDGCVSISEKFRFSKPMPSVLHFLTPFEPRAEEFGLSLTSENGKTLEMRFDGSFTFDKLSTEDDCRLVPQWGEYIYRINIPVTESKSGEFKYKFI